MDRLWLATVLVLALLSGCIDADPPATASSSGEAVGPDSVRSGPDAGGPGQAHEWPPLDEATIRPGVALNPLSPSDPEGLLDDAHCTANFVFLDRTGGILYLGTAAHCVEDGSESQRGHCDSTADPLGTEIRIEGASRPGRLAFSSALTMQAVGEPDLQTCTYNDFALIAIDPVDADLVHPAVLAYGGPTDLRRDGASAGQPVVTFGATPFRPGPSSLDSAEGTVTETRYNGWIHLVEFTPPRVSGDSGSAVLTAEGEALGVVKSLTLAGSNGVVDLAMALAYAQDAGGMEVELATWDDFTDP